MKNNKGITIIALVVTIIVLLILSSISISYVINKNGIIDNVNNNKENAEIKSIESKLQAESTSFNIQNNGKLNLGKYISKVEEIGDWTAADNDDEEDEINDDVKENVREIVVNDKYVFETKLDSEGIKIEYLGKKGELGPRVIWHTYSNTYDTLTLNVVTRRNKGGTIQYWIKERGRGEYELKSEQSDNTYTFTGLDINKKYTIKVIAKKDNKQSAPYIIDVDMVKLPELTDENTTFIKTPEVWTNGDVIVTAQTKVTGYTIQTSQDRENWKNITYQTVKKNGKVYARLSDGYNSGKVYETEITNIDKLAPNTFTPTATSTTKSITVTASTTDAAAANGSGSSGIARYRFSKDNGSTWTEYQTSGTYTWNNLPQTTNYTIKVEAKDNAGNVRQGSVSKGTGTVETATGGYFNPTYWTNGNVTVTLPTKSGFTTRYTTDGTKPTKDSTQYTGEFTVSSNCTITYLYTDGTNIGGTGTLNVTNIDKLAPNTFTPTATSTTKSITVTASTTDAAAANGSGSSGIAGYRFSKDNGSTWTEYQTSGEYTWDKLPQTTNYTIKVEAKDNAGNVRQGSVSKGTGTVETATGGYFNPTYWTNGNVTVTLPAKSGFTTRYTIDGTKPTKDSTQYTGTFTVSSNCTITYLYTDGTNIGGTGTLSVTNIDKLAPNTFTPTATSTTKSITVTASTTDAAAANGSGSSGIAGYRFSKDNGSTWTEYQTSGEYTWDKLPQTTNYTIKVEAKDNAGNVRQGSVSKGTGTVETATGGYFNPTYWTNGNVTVTLPAKSGFTTRYTIDGTKPTKDSTQYTGTFTVSSNCTITYLYTDGTNIGGTGTLSVTNIDKLAPNTFTPTATSTTKSITVTASTTDAAAANGSGSSGIAGYRFSKDNGSTWTEYQTSGEYTWDKLPQTTNYTIKVEAKDNAGNVRQGSVSKGTGTVTALTKANTTFKVEPSEAKWTNKDVTVTVSTTVDVEGTGFVLQTSTDGENWYTTNKKPANTAEKVFTKNGTIYARLYDGRNVGEYSSEAITKIDKLAPKAFTTGIEYKELKDADSDTKTEYGFKASLGNATNNGGLDQIAGYTYVYGIQAGDVFYCTGDNTYYLCIKSKLSRLSGEKFTNTEYFENIGTNYYVSFSITGSTEDADATSEYGKSGIDKCMYSTNNGSTWSTKSTYKYSEIPNGKYPFTVKAIDKAGNEKIANMNYAETKLKGPLTETVTAAQIAANPGNYYGKIVTNYKSSNGWSGWKIFYCNTNSTEGKIFLIADDFVPNSIIPDIGLTKSGTYKATWSDTNKLTGVSDSISNMTLTTFMGTGFNITGKNYLGVKAASKLLNSSKWTEFVNHGSAMKAIGGPTIEMWMASWNTLYQSDQLYCNKTNNFGYHVGTTNSPSTDYIDRNVMSAKKGYHNSLYYLSAKSDGARTYWCASPSAYYDTDEAGKRLINIDAIGYVGSDPVYFSVAGIRPVVCLRNDFKIKIIK